MIQLTREQLETLLTGYEWAVSYHFDEEGIKFSEEIRKLLGED